MDPSFKLEHCISNKVNYLYINFKDKFGSSKTELRQYYKATPKHLKDIIIDQTLMKVKIEKKIRLRKIFQEPLKKFKQDQNFPYQDKEVKELKKLNIE